MTSNTTPSGIASASSDNVGTTLAWNAFADSTDVPQWWYSDYPTSINEWVKYTFPSRMRVNRMTCYTITVGGANTPIAFQYSMDDTIRNNIQTFNIITTNLVSVDISFPFIDAKYWRWYNEANSTYMGATGLQLYGYK